MYAAAGGTACRAARKRQQAQEVKAKLEKAKQLKEKLAQSKVNLATPTKSKQFHQLPANYYLKTPYAGGRKLSAGYTGHSKLLLPINEQSAQHHSPSHQQLSSHHHEKNARTPTHHSHYRGDLRLDVEHHKTLTKSATASFPLVSQATSPPPNNNNNNHLCPYHHPQQFKESQSNLLSVLNDGIIITPATPLPSPSPSNKEQQQQLNNQQRASTQDLRLPQNVDDQSDFPPLERTCSVYRNRKLDAETTKVEAQQQSQFYIGAMPNGHQTQFNGDAEFCDAENRACVCTCDRVECTQGRQAWLERGRRCSVQDPSQASYHRRWVKRNRVQDASIGGSSDDEDILGVIRGPSTFANAFLYIGLGTISIGSIIFFVGTGEKGFKTQELRLIGPALAAIGLVFCIIRILFCVCPSHCISRRDRNKKSAKVDVDHRTSLLGDTKRVSIARGPYINSKIPMSSSHSSQFPPKSIVKNKSYEGVEALRQIASTSLFLDNENQQLQQHQRHLTTIIPTIKEPLDEGSSNASLTNLMSQGHDNLLDPPIEMTKMNTLQVDTLNVIDILSLTDEEIEREIRQIDINQEVVIPKVEPSALFDDDCEEFHIDEVDSEKRSASSKLHRQRTSLNQSKKDSDILLMETSLTIIDNASLSPPPYTPPPLPLSPNIVTTTFNLPPSTLSLTLPLTSTTTTSDANNQPPTTTSSSRKHHKHHNHHHSHHHHHHKGSQHKHRHSMAVGRTAPIVDEHGQPIKDSHQVTEAELVLSPSKLGQ